MESKQQSKGDGAEHHDLADGDELCPSRRPDGCLADLECQALVAEQARDLAHRLRSPLGAIELVCESLSLEQPDSEVAERLQVALRATAKLKQALNETVSAVVPRWPVQQPVDLTAACARLASVNGFDCDVGAMAVWVAAAPAECELALWQAASLALLGSRDGQVRVAVVQTPRGVELSFTPKTPLGPLDERLDAEIPAQGLAFLRLKRLQRFAAEQGGALEIEPSRVLLRVRPLQEAKPASG